MLSEVRKGQTMLEVILAIAVSVIVLSAIAILGTAASKLSKASLHSAEGSKLASSGIEAIRYVRDVCGYDDLTDGCYKIDVDSSSVCGVVKILASCDDIQAKVAYSFEGENYTRKIVVEPYAGGASVKRVTSIVSWSQFTGTGNVKSVTFSILLSDKGL